VPKTEVAVLYIYTKRFSGKLFWSAGESEWHISGENDLSIKK